MVAYSEQVGADNIVYRAKISRWSYAVPIAIVIVGLLTMLVIGSIPITPKTIGSGGSVVEYYTINIGLIILAVGLFLLAKNLIYAFSSELYITDKFTIAKYGLIRRETIEMLNSKVESIMVNQSIIGRILNYGDIMIVGAGSASPIQFIDSPLEFRRQWLEIHEKQK